MSVELGHDRKIEKQGFWLQKTMPTVFSEILRCQYLHEYGRKLKKNYN